MDRSRSQIVATARGWLGTPYRHQASRRGVGADCLGLVRGVWRELYGREPETPPPYTRDWTEATGEETLLGAAARHMLAIDPRAAAAGDVLIFRLRSGLAAKHAAILASETAFIHAMEGAPVSEVALTPWWRRRIAGAFAFPGVPTTLTSPDGPQGRARDCAPGLWPGPQTGTRSRWGRDGASGGRDK